MGAVPERCTTCGTKIPEGSSRCIACGKVYGDDNLCPHCHATAGILASAGGFVCAACGRPREKKPGTTVLGEGTGGGRIALAGRSVGAPSQLVVRRGASAGLRAFGAMSIGAGVLLAAIAFMLLPGAAGVIVALLAGSAGVGLGALGLRAGAKQASEADRQERAARERAVLDLAEKSDGDLTATETARALGTTMEEADRILTEMADGSRVTVEVDPDGIVHYVFRELAKAAEAAARVRVQVPSAAMEGLEDEVSVSEVRSRRKKEV